MMNFRAAEFALIWLAAGWIALATDILVFRLVCYFFIGATIQGLAILMHEGVHGMLFRSRSLNRWVAFACGVPALLSVSSYRVGHLPHHRCERCNSDPDELENYSQNPRVLSLLFMATLLFGELFGVFRVGPANLWKCSRSERSNIIVEYGILIAIIVSVAATVPLGVLLHVWIFPVLVGKQLTNVRTLSEHILTDKENRVSPTRTVVSNRFVSFFMCNLNYHVEHHLFPGIPCYNLPQLHHLLAEAFPQYNVPIYKSYSRFLWDLMAFVVKAFLGRQNSLTLSVTSITSWGYEKDEVGFPIQITTDNKEVDMKHFHNTLTTAILFFGSILYASRQTDTLVILHLNDTHSNLAPIGPRDANLNGTLGGVARAASIILGEQLSNQNVLTLHAGDSFIGDLFFNTSYGIAEFSMLRALNLGAMAVGNHEFDLTPVVLNAALDAAFAESGFPLLSANVNLEAAEVQPLKKYIAPYLVRQIGNTKVGIFGLTTPATNVLSQPSPAFVDSHIVEISAAIVDTLNAKGCSLIICLSHLGFSLDQAVASYVPGIHLIVGGHDHIKLDQPVPVQNAAGDTTYIVQANAFYLNVGRMKIAVGDGKMKILQYQMLDVDSNVPEVPELKAAVDGLIAGIEETYGPVYSQRIGYASEHFDEVATNLTANGYHDTPIGNLVTDAFRATFHTDIAFEVGGSTAEPIYQGPIVAADLFRVVGYGFNTHNGLGYRMATFKMSGEAIAAGIEFGLSTIEQDDEFLVQASGLSYTYNATRPVGNRATQIMVGNQALDPARSYSVAANEFVPLFLQYLQIPFDSLRVYNDSTEFQVLSAYVAALDTIHPVRRNNVVSPVHDSKNDLPRAFELKQNFPNPFNPATVISYQLPVSSHVTLKVYNLLGEEIAILIDERIEPGEHRVMFKATRLPSGVYFVRMTANNTHSVRKILLMK
jgi:5'-nucleotidase